ncbi:MAG: polysaccharide deacetylase family protein [Clostridiaceae bacterium]|nr:polysaccharide deacetylase family protein [Clostridiaceae bacterium]
MKKRYFLAYICLIFLICFSLSTHIYQKTHTISAYSSGIKNVLNQEEIYDRISEIFKIRNSAFINSKKVQAVQLDGFPEKKAYITFDDGPTYVVTNQILDILKKYNVKATFFVVGKEIDGKEEILKRIYKEGHGIGVHTYSHNFKSIYRSENSFVNENIKAAQKVVQVTGFYPKAVRFPGGSSKILTPSLLEELHKNNFKIYDWNASLEDGVNAYLNENTLLKNSLRIKGDKNNVIILMHCNSNNKNTVKALPKIIERYKAEGYSIEPITYSTKEYYYKIKIK